MPRRVNIMMDDDAWRVIERPPRGVRSRAVDAAIRDWSRAAARREAAARMDLCGHASLRSVRTTWSGGSGDSGRWQT